MYFKDDQTNICDLRQSLRALDKDQEDARLAWLLHFAPSSLQGAEQLSAERGTKRIATDCAKEEEGERTVFLTSSDEHKSEVADEVDVAQTVFCTSPDEEMEEAVAKEVFFTDDEAPPESSVLRKKPAKRPAKRSAVVSRKRVKPRRRAYSINLLGFPACERAAKTVGGDRQWQVGANSTMSYRREVHVQS